MGDGRPRPAVFLDRDGVLNELVAEGDPGRPPFSIDEVRLCEGAAEPLAELRRAGFLLVVLTNQPDVARGFVLRDAVDAVNRHVAESLGTGAVYVCVHDGRDACRCRKPRPGMLLDAAADHGIDLDASWSIGDRWVDVAAGQAAGVRSVLLERPWSWLPTSAGPPPAELAPDARFATLAGCVDYVLARWR